MDPRNMVSIGLVTIVIVLAFLRMVSWFDGIVNTTLRVLIFVVVICTSILLAFSAVKKLKR